jgi:predicted ATP-grasp superfamily ATP-dependent carboligase
MPLPLPGRSPEPGAAILIAAASGRALAGAARRAGYRPLVADFFGDMDTCEFAVAHRLIDDGLDRGFCRETLLPALEDLAAQEEPAGLVYGTGFEDRTEILEDLSEHFPLFGNRPEVVRRVKDPFALAQTCERLGVPHPKIQTARPKDCANWLVKSMGGAGGTHVAPAATAYAHEEGTYYQRIAAGEPVSLLFLADGSHALALGASRQWTQPTPTEPFRYGGCLRPANLPDPLAQKLAVLAEALASACALRGLNSLDLLIHGETITLLEINPRPGSTLDIFEDRKGTLFMAHLEACVGKLPFVKPAFDGPAAAAAVAFARGEIASMPQLDWPHWAADRQNPKTRLHPDDPICTVKAHADEAAQARRLVDERTALILDHIETSAG